MSPLVKYETAGRVPDDESTAECSPGALDRTYVLGTLLQCLNRRQLTLLAYENGMPLSGRMQDLPNILCQTGSAQHCAVERSSSP